jgi:RNA polymerase sigma factor for flagellar operon FliA
MAIGERTRLVQEFLPLVRRLAGRMVLLARPYLETDDLVSIGVEALLRASVRYDPGRGVQFGTFAYLRVRGAMLEGIGAVGPFSRGLVRRRAGRAEPRMPPRMRRFDELQPEAAGERDTTEDQIALAIDAARLRPHLRAAVASLDEPCRQIILRHYCSGDSLLEIGQTMGRSRSWASRAHSTALARLRAALEPAAPGSSAWRVQRGVPTPS